jgi:hypothetical protein
LSDRRIHLRRKDRETIFEREAYATLRDKSEGDVRDTLRGCTCGFGESLREVRRFGAAAGDEETIPEKAASRHHMNLRRDRGGIEADCGRCRLTAQCSAIRLTEDAERNGNVSSGDEHE